MSSESILLTGGSSQRMGMSKAHLSINGVPLGARIARELVQAGWPVTVLGREPIAGYPFLADAKEYAGPLAALRQFQPGADAVFIAACDMPLFHGEVAKLLRAALQDEDDAVVPVLDGKLQPLSAVYRKRCFYRLIAKPEMERMTDWLGQLKIRTIEELPFPADWIRSVNTPDELQALLGRAG